MMQKFTYNSKQNTLLILFIVISNLIWCSSTSIWQFSTWNNKNAKICAWYRTAEHLYFIRYITVRTRLDKTSRPLHMKPMYMIWFQLFIMMFLFAVVKARVKGSKLIYRKHLDADKKVHRVPFQRMYHIRISKVFKVNRLH